jgi:hypothetical protein
MNSPKYLIAAAALSGLLAGASSRAIAAAPVAPVSSSVSVSAGARAMPAVNVNVGVLLAAPEPKHDCKGKNDCKGVGGCKAGDNGCKGKNSCKGKGGCKTNETPKEPKLLAATGLDLGALALA